MCARRTRRHFEGLQRQNEGVAGGTNGGFKDMDHSTRGDYLVSHICLSEDDAGASSCSRAPKWELGWREVVGSSSPTRLPRRSRSRSPSISTFNPRNSSLAGTRQPVRHRGLAGALATEEFTSRPERRLLLNVGVVAVDGGALGEKAISEPDLVAWWWPGGGPSIGEPDNTNM